MNAAHLFAKPPYHWNGLYVEGQSPDGKQVVVASCEASDDAEFIVRACNSHDALVKASQAAVAYDAAIRQCGNDPRRMASFCTAEGEDLDFLFHDFVAKAHAALAAAGAK